MCRSVLPRRWLRPALALLLTFSLCLLAGCAAPSDDVQDTVPGVSDASDFSSVFEPDVSSDVSTSSVPDSSESSSDAASTSSTVSAPKTSSAPSSAASASSKPASSRDTAPVAAKPVDEIKAVWLSQYDLLDVLQDGGRQREKADFTTRFSRIASQIKTCGFNTVFLQARPYSDSFYPSEYYPYSKFVTGAYGVSADYDPYAIMVQALRAQGLSVHGWINPLRGMKEDELNDVPARYAIRKWYLDPVKRAQNLVLSDGRWYYNAGSVEVRALIANGAAELLRRYKLDGIHIDDYFFYSSSPVYITALVQTLYETVKSVDKNALFGVSPDGNIERNYKVHLADVKTWCQKRGYLDYICPQLYYGMEHETHPFAESLAEWNALISPSSGVKLLVGLTLSKAGLEDSYAGTGKREWIEHSDVAARSLAAARKAKYYGGVSVFSFQFFYKPGQAERDTRADKEADRLLAELSRPRS